MTKDELKTKARKLEVLSREGKGGERDAARIQLKRLCKKYGIKLDETEPKETFDIRLCNSVKRKTMLYAAEHLGLTMRRYVYHRGQFCIEATRSEWELCKTMFEDSMVVYQRKLSEAKRTARSYLLGFLRETFPAKDKDNTPPTCPACGSEDYAYNHELDRAVCGKCGRKGRKLNIDVDAYHRGADESGRLIKGNK